MNVRFSCLAKKFTKQKFGRFSAISGSLEKIREYQSQEIAVRTCGTLATFYDLRATCFLMFRYVYFILCLSYI